MYAILKPIQTEDLADLQYSHDLFYCGEATGNPHLFDTEDEAEHFQAFYALDGKIIELLIED